MQVDGFNKSVDHNIFFNTFEHYYKIALHSCSPFIMAICRMDNLKEDFISTFSQIAKNKITKSDTILRFGINEFIILLSSESNSRGYDVLNSIKNEFYDVNIGMLEIRPKYFYEKTLVEDYLTIASKKIEVAKKYTNH
ncbi:hypothetical protein [Arcobacter sp. FWKO B]|uniref:hypothetical protein n=1 Tax=Arcobacter sp. FWKO B TaxID=2593672 RepID=UPI0018A6A32C|nr:hypothetical protein [Arcobacter sp. FWKO B]QOG11527.1 hypothetical protein FWKOB_01925 [Arcobacter sp. FWKO B]